MHHPQDDLLIVAALAEFAYERQDTPIEDHVLELAKEITNHHGLTTAEAIRQREERSNAHCLD